MSDEFAPIDVSSPVWACPVCKETFGSRYEDALRCAQRGAPDVPDVCPLVVDVQGPGVRVGRAVLSPVVVDHVSGRHTRHLSFEGERLDAFFTGSGVAVIGGGDADHSRDGYLSGGDGHFLGELFAGVDLLLVDSWRHGGAYSGWMRAMTVAERDAVATFAPDSYERLMNASVEGLVESWSRGSGSGRLTPRHVIASTFRTRGGFFFVRRTGVRSSCWLLLMGFRRMTRWGWLDGRIRLVCL